MDSVASLMAGVIEGLTKNLDVDFYGLKCLGELGARCDRAEAQLKNLPRREYLVLVDGEVDRVWYDDNNVNPIKTCPWDNPLDVYANKRAKAADLRKLGFKIPEAYQDYYNLTPEEACYVYFHDVTIYAGMGLSEPIAVSFKCDNLTSAVFVFLKKYMDWGIAECKQYAEDDWPEPLRIQYSILEMFKKESLELIARNQGCGIVIDLANL